MMESRHGARGATAPGPRGLPLAGPLLEVRRRNLPELLSEWHVAYGPVVRTRIFHRLFHSIASPALAQEVLVNRADDFPKIGFIQRSAGLPLFLRNGLITSMGAHWRKQQRTMLPVFRRGSFAALAPQFKNASLRLFERWSRQPDGAVVDVAEEMMQLALDAVALALFSTDLGEQNRTLRESMDRCLQFCFKTMVSPLRFPLSWPLPAHRRFLEARAALDGIADHMIQIHRERPGSNDDLLARMLKAVDPDTGESMSDSQLREECITILGAGHETTAQMLTWTLHLLAQNPTECARVCRQLDELGGRIPHFEDLDKLTYLQQAMQESTRLFPPVPVMVRTCKVDEELGGYHIPARSRILICMYHVHRDQQWWSTPERFDPQRFGPERREPAHKMASFPLGAGLRICIGSSMALAEGGLLLGHLLHRFELRPIPGGPPVKAHTPLTAMRPLGGLPMTLHRR